MLFMLDSVTRVARAQREIGLAAGEPPARQGYPPSVFAMLPRLLERTGTDARGSITALYTVLVAGGDMEEPIADEVRGILDGHVILSRELAARNQWPAIDVLPSLSRVMNAVADPAHRAAAQRLRELLATYERQRDLHLCSAPTSAAPTRSPIARSTRMDAITTFLRQRTDERAPFADTIARLRALVDHRSAPQARCATTFLRSRTLALRARAADVSSETRPMSDPTACSARSATGRSRRPSPTATTTCSRSRTSGPRRRCTSWWSRRATSPSLADATPEDAAMYGKHDGRRREAREGERSGRRTGFAS